MTQRKVYTDHPAHGTCITFESTVYLAPAGAVYNKKERSTVDIVRTSEEGAHDSEGRIWTRKGFNPGCGTRCPAELRELLTSAFTAAHADFLPDPALAELRADQRPTAQLRSTWLFISNDTRKLVILAAQGKLPKRTAPAVEPSELDTLLTQPLTTQNI